MTKPGAVLSEATREKNRARMREYRAEQRARMQADPEYAERVRARQRERNDTPEQRAKARERAREWARLNKPPAPPREPLTPEQKAERAREYQRRYMQTKGNEARRVKHANDRDRRWAEMLWQKYSITADDYAQMLEEQNGVCALCFKGNGKRRLAVDHCHETGRVRGLLCTPCNVRLGVYEGTPVDWINRAASYVQKISAEVDNYPTA